MRDQHEGSVGSLELRSQDFCPNLPKSLRNPAVVRFEQSRDILGIMNKPTKTPPNLIDILLLPKAAQKDAARQLGRALQRNTQRLLNELTPRERALVAKLGEMRRDAKKRS